MKILTIPDYNNLFSYCTQLDTMQKSCRVRLLKDNDIKNLLLFSKYFSICESIKMYGGYVTEELDNRFSTDYYYRTEIHLHPQTGHAVIYRTSCDNVEYDNVKYNPYIELTLIINFIFIASSIQKSFKEFINSEKIKNIFNIDIKTLRKYPNNGIIKIFINLK
jgi:hypothetical protein